MTSAVFDTCLVDAFTGKINIPANTMGGSNAGYTPSYPGCFAVLGTVAPDTHKTAWNLYSDISSAFEIGVVNGYALGGRGLATTVPVSTTVGSTGVIGLKSSLATMVFTTTGTITASYVIIQLAPTSSTTAGNYLIGWLGIGSNTVNNGTLTLTWATNIFTWTVGAPA